MVNTAVHKNISTCLGEKMEFDREKRFYKIVEYKDGVIKSIFHGTQGTRIVPLFTWMKADIKMVHDGSRGTPYKSGWHVFETFAEAEKYLELFTHKEHKAIVRCRCNNLWRKEHARAKVWLAENMFMENVSINFSWKKEKRNKAWTKSLKGK